MDIDAEQLAFFRELETSLHRRAVRSSPEADTALLADDFLEFGRSGRVYDKRQTIAALQAEEVDLEIDVRDFAARRLSPTVVLVTYRSVMKVMEQSTHRSSIWTSIDRTWRMNFHQGTPADRR